MDNESQVIEAFLKSYENSFLSVFIIQPEVKRVELHLGFSPNEKGAILKLNNVIHLKSSKTFDAVEGPFYVGEMKMVRLNDGDEGILVALQYPFHGSNGKIVPYPNQALFHFHLEGEMILDIICVGYEIFKQV